MSADQLARALTDALEYIEDYKGEKQQAYAGYPKAWAAMDEFLQEARQALAAHRAQAGEAEPRAWLYQHDETGRNCFCPNDGVNTRESFERINPRLRYVCALYASPHQVAQPRKGASHDPRHT